MSLQQPHKALRVIKVAFPIVAERVLHHLKQLSAVTFMPVLNLKQLIRIAQSTMTLTALRCKSNETDLSLVCR